METFTATQRAIRIERFQPKREGSHPAALILHGADGLPGRGMAYRDLAARFALSGYVSFLPHYFDATESQTRPNPLNPLHFAAWMGALREGIGYVTRQPDVLAESVALVGFSLGGYLAVAVGAQDSRVGAVVECSGGAADIFFGDVKRMPPVLILHGEEDGVVPVSEAYRLEKLLQERAQAHEMIIYPRCGHQFRATDFEDAMRRSLIFLGRHLHVKVA